ncbi:hypothetical protein SAMN04488518_103252 [Pseudovibrio ascidiaceicola]|uniref:DUF1284 domain-containing protein n=1 Tax=Pseudovibrio ascidiaceicola TaxID=285279 RepID=A0A1I3XZS4_9HYPH|nr:DUF1284 domain-containing protein [Pseudovibrio ascidiaceicola]SFK25013.1 hypothetical protein SAMN04488518_103252 [Pseudovibrio ascidiaceicola]
MSVKLRGHHLLCVLTFIGHGYSPAFSKNYEAVVKRLNAGEAALLVEGPDEICAVLINEEEQPHCFNCSVVERDSAAVKLISRLLGTELCVGDEIVMNSHLVAKMRKAYAEDVFKKACQNCEWVQFCDEISSSGFQKVLLRHPEHH